MDAKRKKIYIAILAIAVIAILAAGLVFIGMKKEPAPLDPENAVSVSIKIPSGSTTAVIGQTLEDNGIIADAGKFRRWSKLNGYDSQYKAGTYALSPSMDYKTIAEIVVGGKVSTKTFTIPEGYTIYQTADKLAGDGLIDKEKFTTLLESDDFDADYPFLADAQKNKNHLEGYLMPNTYLIEEGASEEQIIRTMLNQFEKDVWEPYENGELTANSKISSKYSLADILKAASIIERECGKDEERPVVASVIYNRLDKGMNLQMCSTVQYILGKQKVVLSVADTQIDSPYNTYLNPGLPPGPICSPGLASINAALNPAETDYLYFVLSEKLDGTSNFSSDYQKFLKDKAAYDQAYTAAHQ